MFKITMILRSFKPATAIWMSTLIVSLALTISCDYLLDDIIPEDELDKLPPLTTTGENTFGCLVNGKAFVVTSAIRKTAIYQRDNLQLGGGVKSENEDLSITIFPPYPSLKEFMAYDITNAAKFYDFKEGCYYELNNTNKGHIQFSKIDRTNFIISGTFEFSTVTDKCDTVRITDGRFDVQYTP